MTNFYVAANLKRDNREYVSGDRIEMSDDQAASLMDAGVLSTDPATDHVAPSQPIEVERREEASVGGEAVQTGEPSIDGRPGDAADADAKDITPASKEAAAETATEEPKVSARAPRASKPAPVETPAPEIDPSANL